MPPLQLNPSVVLATAEDGYLAYNVESNRLHRLNPTAALLVELCDGARSQEQLLEQVAPILGAVAIPGCMSWIAQALEENLLLSAPSPIRGPLLSADELQQHATRLRRQDRVLAAYVCQSRAAELAPDDADQWYALGELAHIIGRRDEARTAYERYQQSHPDDVEVQHLLIALRDEPPPGRAPDHYIEQLYSYFAPFYDDNMCGDLDYRAPELLNAALKTATGNRTDLTVLELGCGTGLFGELIRPRARSLTGIDLSPDMVERARTRMVEGRCIYDRLDTAEITAWLASEPEPSTFDVIAICDTLIYFGDLRQVLPSAARHLAPGGIIGFTVEQGKDFPFRLTDSGRFAHHRDHLLEVVREAGLDVATQTAEVLRYEYGHPVNGWVTVLRLSATRETASELHDQTA